MKITVAIPLYHAEKWIDRISQNINHLPINCEILVSSQTPEDGVIDRLKELHNGDKRIRFFLTDGLKGWRTHVNQLIQNCQSEAFSILAQDDWIDSIYYPALIAKLESDPKAVMTFGQIIGYHMPGLDAPCAMPMPENRPAIVPYKQAIHLLKHWNLGIPYRGLIRTTYLQLIEPTPGDQFADLIWVFGLACKGHIYNVPEATYHKHYSPESAHAQWAPFETALDAPTRLKLLKREIKRAYLSRPLLRILACLWLKLRYF